MPFDPNLPQPNTLADADQMRGQLNGLKADYEAQIAAIPAGPAGLPGPQGIPGPANWFISENDPGGSDGDCWLRPSDGAVFRKDAGSWNQFGSIQGPVGPQGPAGDVSAQQLNDAIATTALNPAGIAPWSGSFSDPPTQAEMNDFAAWVEGFRAGMVR